MEVNRIGAKLPALWTERPDLWFKHVEAQFNLAKVTTEETKFHHVVASLDQQQAIKVCEIISNPPTTNQYQELKNELLKKLTPSNEERRRRLLAGEEIGDRKPSEFREHMLALAPDTWPEDLLKSLWSSQLPRAIRTALLTRPDLNWKDSAEIADSIAEAVPEVSTHAIEQPTPTSSALERQIEELSQQVAAINSNNLNKSAPAQQRTWKTDDRRSRGINPEVCWFHREFGKNARNCRQPCAFKAQGNSKGGQ